MEKAEVGGADWWAGPEWQAEAACFCPETSLSSVCQTRSPGGIGAGSLPWQPAVWLRRSRVWWCAETHMRAHTHAHICTRTCCWPLEWHGLYSQGHRGTEDVK